MGKAIVDKKQRIKEYQAWLRSRGDKKRFCEELKNTRKRRGLSQEAIAKYLGCEQNYVSRVECGKINISLETFLRWASLLDISIIAYDQIEKDKKKLFPPDKSCLPCNYSLKYIKSHKEPIEVGKYVL